MKELIVSRLKELGEKLPLMEDGSSVKFKAAAYKRAAETIGNLGGEDISVDDIEGLPGVGESILKKVAEILETGTLRKLEEFRGSERDCSDLMRIDGVGPATARKLYDGFGVRTVEELKAKLGSEIDDAKLAKRVDELLSREKRIPHEIAREMARAIMDPLREACPKAELSEAGSLRRKTPDSKDIDIVFAGSKRDKDKARDVFLGLEWDEVKSSGDTRVSAVMSGVGVDIRFVDADCYGATLLYFTGSKDFNIVMRGMAKKRGLKLNEYGLWKGEKRVAGETEEDVFEALGIPYVKPEDRKPESLLEVK